MGKMNYGKYDMSEQLTVHAQCTMYTLTYAQALQKKNETGKYVMEMNG